MKSEVLITLLTFEVTSSFPVEDVVTGVVVPLPTPVVDSTFSVFVIDEENTLPDDVLPDVKTAVVWEISVRVVPGDSVLDVDVTVLDFTFDVTYDVTGDVLGFDVDGKENVFAVVEVVGVSVVYGCEGTIVTPGLKHCTLIGEFSVKCKG